MAYVMHIILSINWHPECRVSQSGAGKGGGGGAWGCPPSHDLFFEPLPPPPFMKADAPPHGVLPSHLKMKPPLKNEASFQKMIPRKQSQKSKTVINTCVSFIKQELKKMTEIPEKHDSLTWNIQSFVRKVKQFVRKFYITLLPNYMM